MGVSPARLHGGDWRRLEEGGGHPTQATPLLNAGHAPPRPHAGHTLPLAPGWAG